MEVGVGHLVKLFGTLDALWDGFFLCIVKHRKGFLNQMIEQFEKKLSTWKS